MVDSFGGRTPQQSGLRITGCIANMGMIFTYKISKTKKKHQVSGATCKSHSYTHAYLDVQAI